MAFGVNKGSRGSDKNTTVQPLSIFPARTKAIVLDSTTYSNLYKQYGEEASIGGISFERLNYPSNNKEAEGVSFALPLFPNFNHYPIEQEIVTIISTGGLTSNDSTNQTTYYYLPPVNSWTSTHINAVPNEVNSSPDIPTSQQKSYSEVFAGSTNKTSPIFKNTLQFKYGIKERKNIRPLLPQPGDISFEGRWGQSIRLGSTNRSALPNTWSNIGQEGDPILILRNRQYESTLDPWIPLSENINLDGGSIYFTSTQQIDINTVNFKTDSFGTTTAPEKPSEYSKDQIILDSGRLIFVSKEESILLTAIESIHLSAINFNVDSDSTTIASNQIKLGGASNLQPVLKGDDTVDCLSRLLTQLSTFMTIVAATNLPGISDTARTIIPELQAINLKVNTQIRSTITSTK